MTMWLPSNSATKRTYLTIFQSLKDDIEAGRLRPGDRLPTQRELADALGVSLGTVTRGYALARRQGLIDGVIGRGTFVTEPESAPLAAFDEQAALDVSWPLYALDPDLSTTLMQVAADPACRRLLRYQDNAGAPGQREAGEAWVRELGVDAGWRNVSVCSGTQHALTVLLSAVAEPGETVLADSLTYPGIKSIARLLRINLVGVRCDRGGLVPEALETACRLRDARALYCIPALHNPTTSTLSDERRNDIAEIAARNNVYVIEDAVHQPLAPQSPAPIAARAPDHTFFVAALSKSVAGGLRVAYVVSPPGMQETVARGIWATNWMTAPLCAEVARRWINDGTAWATAVAKREEASARSELADRSLGKFGLVTAKGAYHAWLPLPSVWGRDAFANEARRLGAPVTGADAFAVGPDAAPNAARLSLSAPHTRERLERALNIVGSILERSPEATGPVV